MTSVYVPKQLLEVFKKKNKKLRIEMRDNAAKMESTTAKLNNSINESMRMKDSLNMEEFSKQNARNLDAFMAERREQENKNKKRMYWRLGFGVLMLVILGVGMARKKKQKV